MEDPAENAPDNIALKQRMKHCICQMRGICSTCIYFINAELKEKEVTDDSKKKGYKMAVTIKHHR